MYRKNPKRKQFVIYCSLVFFLMICSYNYFLIPKADQWNSQWKMSEKETGTVLENILVSPSGQWEEERGLPLFFLEIYLKDKILYTSGNALLDIKSIDLYSNPKRYIKTDPMAIPNGLLESISDADKVVFTHEKEKASIEFVVDQNWISSQEIYLLTGDLVNLYISKESYEAYLKL